MQSGTVLTMEISSDALVNERIDFVYDEKFIQDSC
jgi:hypothetical protein